MDVADRLDQPQVRQLPAEVLVGLGLVRPVDGLLVGDGRGDALNRVLTVRHSWLR